MNIIIIFYIAAAVTLQRYLDSYFDNNRLKDKSSFSTTVNLFAFTYLIGLIWIFGWLAGLIVFFLFYFDIIYSGILWIINFPFALFLFNKKHEVGDINEEELDLYIKDQIKKLVPVRFENIYIAMLSIFIILTISNFFISSYKSGINLFSRELYIYGAIVIVIGNIIRIFLQNIFFKQ